MTISVAIIDDHVLFCAGLQMLIESQSDLSCAGIAYDGIAALELVATAQPDVVLMDIRMPQLDGISATAALRRNLELDEGPRIIVLTTHQGDVAVREALNAGAHGFLMKDVTPELLLAAIRSVYAGSAVIAPSAPREFVRTHVERGIHPDVDLLAELSSREREVFLLAARGLSTSEIAEAAFVSENTVKTHISTILRKLGLATRLQLIAFAYENALVR